jgi:hypothetical protein
MDEEAFMSHASPELLSLPAGRLSRQADFPTAIKRSSIVPQIHGD